MTDGLTRRDALAALAGSAAVIATPALDQALSPFDLSARLAELSGVNPLPHRALNRLYDAVSNEGGLPTEAPGLTDAQEARFLKALYTGVLAPPETGGGDEARRSQAATDNPGPGIRIAFAEALMWYAVQDYKNVYSYCGGLPGFWAEPPQVG